MEAIRMTTINWRQDLDVLRAALTTAQQAATIAWTSSLSPMAPPNSAGYCTNASRCSRRSTSSGQPQASPQPRWEEVLAAEILACGHVDYTAMFAMGCADLVAS